MSMFKSFRRLAAHLFNVMKSPPTYPNVHPTAHLSQDARVSSPNDLIMEEGTSIPTGAVIMNGARGKFIMKKWSFSSIDLLVICGNHMPVVGMPLIKVTDELKSKLDVDNKYSSDVIVDEDVWIGARVTLLPGVHIGRGSIIAAGAVVASDVKPYSIVGGVPSKFIKYKWTMEEIIQHESMVYEESNRLSYNEIRELFSSPPSFKK